MEMEWKIWLVKLLVLHRASPVCECVTETDIFALPFYAETE